MIVGFFWAPALTPTLLFFEYFLLSTRGNPGDKTWGDNWTAVTTDGKRSSQFEHTLIVTETGYELLTARDNEPVMQWNPELNQR